MEMEKRTLTNKMKTMIVEKQTRREQREETKQTVIYRMCRMTAGMTLKYST